MEIIAHTTQDTKSLAASLAKTAKPNTVYALYGDLGSGKTTFARYLVEALGFSSRVQSPTFVISRHYAKESGKIQKVFHIDLYRITSEDMLADLGLEELYKEPKTITIIEWPEILTNLPRNAVKVHFEDVGDSVRKIRIHE